MGCLCQEREKNTKSNIKNIQIGSFKITKNYISKSYNQVYNNKIDEIYKENLENLGDDSKNKTKKLNNEQKSENKIKIDNIDDRKNNCFNKSSINSNNNNENNQNNKEKDDPNINTKSSVKQVIFPEIREINNYSNMNDKDTYYLLCPKCKSHTPFIKDIKYDNKNIYYMIKKKCHCNSQLDNDISLNILSKNEPSDIPVKQDNIKSRFNCNGFKECFDGRYEENRKNKIYKSNNEFEGGPTDLHEIKKKGNEINVKSFDTCRDISSISCSNISYQIIEKQENYGKFKNVTECEIEQKVGGPKEEFIKTFNFKNRVISLIELKSGRLAAGTEDTKIFIWDLDLNEPHKKIQELGKVLCLLEFEENKILSGTTLNNICLRDLNSNNDDEYIFNFLGHQKYVQCLAKYNEQIFTSASNDGTIRIWNYYERSQIKVIYAHKSDILCLIKLSDDNLCSGGADLSIKIWNWEQNQCLKIIENAHNQFIKCLLEMNESIISGGDDDKIKIWGRNGCCNNILIDHQHSIRSLCKIDKNYFASGSFDNKIKIWDFNSNKCIQTLSGHSSNVIQIIKLKNNFLASCSMDKTVKIWDINKFIKIGFSPFFSNN